MKLCRWGIGAMLLLASPGSAASVSQEMPAWLTGGWLMESASGAWIEEWWTPPKGAQMMGAGRSGKADKLDWWEHTRIESAGGKLRFCALPKGQAGACFDAVENGATMIAFENPAHDFPNRVSYRREGDELFAEISGKNGANLQRWRYRRID